MNSQAHAPTITDLRLAAAMAEVSYTQATQDGPAVSCLVEATAARDYGSALDRAHELATELHSAGWEVCLNRRWPRETHDELTFARRLDPECVSDGSADPECTLYLAEDRDTPPADDPQRMTVADWPEADPSRAARRGKRSGDARSGRAGHERTIQSQRAELSRLQEDIAECGRAQHRLRSERDQLRAELAKTRQREERS